MGVKFRSLLSALTVLGPIGNVGLAVIHRINRNGHTLVPRTWVSTLLTVRFVLGPFPFLPFVVKLFLLIPVDPGGSGTSFDFVIELRTRITFCKSFVFPALE